MVNVNTAFEQGRHKVLQITFEDSCASPFKMVSMDYFPDEYMNKKKNVTICYRYTPNSYTRTKIFQMSMSDITCLTVRAVVILARQKERLDRRFQDLSSLGRIKDLKWGDTQSAKNAALTLRWRNSPTTPRSSRCQAVTSLHSGMQMSSQLPLWACLQTSLFFPGSAPGSCRRLFWWSDAEPWQQTEERSSFHLPLSITSFNTSPMYPL